MHPYRRSERVSDLLREEIAEIVLHRVKDPRIGFVTITAVKVTEDLRLAKVYLTVLDKDREAQTLKGLNAAKGFIRSELAKRVRMKILPALEFHKDEAFEYGMKIDRLLRKIKEEDEPS